MLCFDYLLFYIIVVHNGDGPTKKKRYLQVLQNLFRKF
jgi:hypothetical protein